MLMPKRVTRLQDAIARERVHNPGATQREIGCKLGTSRPHVARELAKPHVAARAEQYESRMQIALSKHGGTHERCAKNLVDKMDGDEAMPSLKATELILKLHGELPNAPPVNVAIFTPEDLHAFVAARNARNQSKLPS